MPSRLLCLDLVPATPEHVEAAAVAEAVHDVGRDLASIVIIVIIAIIVVIIVRIVVRIVIIVVRIVIIVMIVIIIEPRGAQNWGSLAKDEVPAQRFAFHSKFQ